jgi:hypothetical protein
MLTPGMVCLEARDRTARCTTARCVARFFFLLPLQHLWRTVGDWMQQLLAYGWHPSYVYARADLPTYREFIAVVEVGHPLHSLHGIVTMKSLAFNTLKRAHRWQR